MAWFFLDGDSPTILIKFHHPEGAGVFNPITKYGGADQMRGSLLQSFAEGGGVKNIVAENQAHPVILPLSQMSGEELVKTVTHSVISVALKILVALLIFWVGRWLIRRARKVMERIMIRRRVDVSLRAFLMSLVNITLTLFLIIIIIGVLGIDTTSFIALFASAGLAIGMALSGTLQNFAGGVMILLFRPFRVGDYIEAQGEEGAVVGRQLMTWPKRRLPNCSTRTNGY